MAIKETVGKLDRYVQVVEFVSTKDDYNATSREQTDVKNVWAQLKFKSSGEDWEEKVFSLNNRDYIIHYDEDITSKNLQELAIIDEGVTYYVTGANKDFGGRKMYVLLNCEARG